MSLITFPTTTGRIIFVEAIYAQPTYLGVGVGRPDRAANREVAQNIVSRVRKIWADVPVALVASVDVDVLPKYCVAAKAFSTQPVGDTTMDASHLVLVFFTDSIPCEGEFAVESLRAFPWEANAHDFGW